MYDRMRGLCAPFLLTAFVLFFTGTAAIADDDNDAWHVSNAFGNVWVTVGGVQHVSLSRSRILKPGDSIQTGQNGRALLVHGEEYILISPSSAIEIPRQTKQGLFTTIIQRAGSIVLEVEKRNVKHFEVRTPLLAALVKGTRFRVTIEENNSYVDVLRGQVEVSDFRSGQYALVEPGQTAKVSRQRSGLSLSGSGTSGSIQQGMPRPSLADPIPETNGQERRADAGSTQNDQQIDQASSHREAEAIPASPGKSTAKQDLDFSLSMNPLHGSPELNSQVSPAQNTEEDHSAAQSAAGGPQVRVASLLNPGDPRNEGVSEVAALQQGVGNVNDLSKPDDDTTHMVLVIGIALIVSFGAGVVRRLKNQKQN